MCVMLTATNLQKINKLQESLLGAGSLQKNLEKITKGMVRIFNADFSRIWVAMPGDLCNSGCIHANPKEKKNLCRTRDRCLHLMASSGRYTHTDGPHSRMPFGLYKLGRVATGKLAKFLTNNVTKDPQIMDHNWARELDLVSFAGYKLQNTAGEPIGVLALFSKHPIAPEEDLLLTGLAGTTTQVIQSGKAQEALKFERNKLRGILDSLGDGVYIVNKDYQIEYTNPALEKEFGRGGKGLECYKYFVDSKGPCPWCRLPEVLAGKTVRREWNYNRNNKTYEKLDTPLINHDGSISSLGIFHDITQRKEAEKELARLNGELDDKNKELEQVINIASHDLRSPLRNIQGFIKELDITLKKAVSIINNDNVSPSEKKKIVLFMKKDIPETCDYICVCASKMEALISGLLEVSRLGRMKLVFTQFDMNKLVKTIKKSLDYTITQRGAKLVIGELPPCRGDAMRISQVFSNLLNNALKYLSPNRPGIITISGQRKKGEVLYCVEDNGIGISEKYHEKIFGIFHRLDPKAGTGEGLGLSIVSKILVRHGGRVWVESKSNMGSKFFVSLPA